jgi:hypothetical protein
MSNLSQKLKIFVFSLTENIKLIYKIINSTKDFLSFL